MLLPHLVILAILGIGAVVVYIISIPVVLFTGKYPRGLFDYMVGVQQWSNRVNAWIFILTDAYPTFDFNPDSHPLRFTVEYPPDGRVPRWRAIPLLSAIMAIPVLVVGEVLLLVGFLLLYLPPFIPGVLPLIILFTGKYPEGLFNLIRGGMRLYARGQSYALFMVGPYPPFDLD